MGIEKYNSKVFLLIFDAQLRTYGYKNIKVENDSHTRYVILTGYKNISDIRPYSLIPDNVLIAGFDCTSIFYILYYISQMLVLTRYTFELYFSIPILETNRQIHIK